MSSPKFDANRVTAQSLIATARKRVAAAPEAAEFTLTNAIAEQLWVVPERLRTQLLLDLAVGLLAGHVLGETKDVLAEIDQ